MTEYEDLFGDTYTIDQQGKVSGPDSDIAWAIEDAVQAGIDEEHLDEIYPLTRIASSCLIGLVVTSACYFPLPYVRGIDM